MPTRKYVKRRKTTETPEQQHQQQRFADRMEMHDILLTVPQENPRPSVRVGGRKTN